MVYQQEKMLGEKIEEILSKMTVEEKVAQMQQLSANATPEDVFKKFKEEGKIGSYLHVLGEETDGFLQSAEKTELKIPPIFGIDAIHGHSLLKSATIFPSQLAMACSWSPELLEEVGFVTANEVAADGLNWVFSPVLCLGRDLRWGRVDETFGEDALLTSRLGAAMIEGYQKNGKVAACAKHYLGYGEATGGRDSYDTEITERKAREVFLKPFKAAVDAGCMTFMTAYGSIDGESLTVSHRYLTEILKDEFGFDGFIVTDWENFRAMVSGQKLFESMDTACVEGIVAGNDMSMNSFEFYEALVTAVKEGRVSMEIIDNAVRRILSVKARLGLLNEKTENQLSRSIIGCDEHQAFNYEVSLKSAVLLKNDGVLPLTNAKKIAVLGANADDMRAQYGDWTYFSHPNEKPWETAKENSYTLIKGIKEAYKDSEVVYSKGCSVENTESAEESDRMMNEALCVVQNSDVCIIAIGDVLAQNGESKDRANLVFSGRQIELVKRVKALGKKVIVVLINGKPLELGEVELYADAIVESFNGGDRSGLALAKLIKGEENFTGKLPISFPYSSAAVPCYYNQYDYWHFNQKYVDVPAGSPYPFGFGLSYSNFVYGEATLDKTMVTRGEKATISVEIKNESAVDGEEIVQLYFKDKICKILTPVRNLLDFKRVKISAGESIKVNFEIDPETLGYYDKNCNYCVDNGDFALYISGNGKDFKEVTLTLKD